MADWLQCNSIDVCLNFVFVKLPKLLVLYPSHLLRNKYHANHFSTICANFPAGTNLAEQLSFVSGEKLLLRVFSEVDS